MNAGKILWRPIFGRFSLNLAIFGRLGPILTIQFLFGLFMQNDVVSEQYFYMRRQITSYFRCLINFQEVVGIFGEDITV